MMQEDHNQETGFRVKQILGSKEATCHQGTWSAPSNPVILRSSVGRRALHSPLTALLKY